MSAPEKQGRFIKSKSLSTGLAEGNRRGNGTCKAALPKPVPEDAMHTGGSSTFLCKASPQQDTSKASTGDSVCVRYGSVPSQEDPTEL